MRDPSARRSTANTAPPQPPRLSRRRWSSKRTTSTTPATGTPAALPWDSPSRSLPSELQDARNTYLLSKKHFACTECGKCCTGAGVVWANRAELEAMRNAIDAGMSIEDFIATFVDKDEMERRGVDVEKKEWFILKNADGKLNGTEYCVFLDPETNHCGVYSARPLQCSTYPWWPELLSSSEWREEGASVCEGIILDGEEAGVDHSKLTPDHEKKAKLDSFVRYLDEFPHKDQYN